MKTAANFLLYLSVGGSVHAFHTNTAVPFRRPRTITPKPSVVYSELSSDAVVLEDVDGVGAAADKKNLSASRVDLESEKTEDLKDDVMQLLIDVEEEAAKVTEEMMDEECVIDESGSPIDELCVEGEEREGFRAKLKKTIGSTLQMIRGMPAAEEAVDGEEKLLEQGDLLEQGWYKRGGASALRRNAEVWKFALKSVIRVLKPRSMRKKGASNEEIEKAQTEAAEFIRDGLLTLGPTFVKLGQVCRLKAKFDHIPFVCSCLQIYLSTARSCQHELMYSQKHIPKC